MSQALSQHSPRVFLSAYAWCSEKVLKIHGAHVIIVTDGAREIPDRTIEEAAVVAACNSAAGMGAAPGAKVPVDYTYVKNVRKPNGAKPGMVIYDSYQTAMVAADHGRMRGLLEG